MLEKLKQLIGISKEAITLELHFHYPDWHPRAGESTHFASKTINTNASKKHHLCLDGSIRKEEADKINKGKAYLRVIYRMHSQGSINDIRITRYRRIRLLQVVIPPAGQDFILVDGKEVPLPDFAHNEGLSPEDFVAWYAFATGRQAVAVQFTDFSY